MIQLLFVTQTRKPLSDLSSVIVSQGGVIHWATSGCKALEIIGEEHVDLVLVDEILDDMKGLTFVKQVVAANPMINCALISSLSESEYHEASEGLGLLLQLPPVPSRIDGERLMAHLHRIVDRQLKQQVTTKEIA